jgi:hypothetical protein
MAVAINWWAILVCMAAAVVVGFAWYGPLFGRAWMKETGIHMPEHGKTPSMTKPILMSLVGAFFMAYTLNHGLVFGNAYLNMSGIGAGLQGSFWYWLGFIVPPMLSFVAWEGKSWKLFFIQAGYWLALLLVMGGILAGWQ